jgi:site-specific DNA-methyltransferase (adenine-specific)
MVTLYCGDMREVLPALDIKPDCAVIDPPYAETSLAWDRWPDGWPALVAKVTSSMWCFGSMRMFLDRRDEFADWKLSQDVVWEKQNGSGFARDRFKRVHEHALHWYRGSWADTYRDVQREPYSGPDSRHGYRGGHLEHTGQIARQSWVDDGTRIVKSVLRAPTMWRRGAVHPTEKPVEILDPLVRYACPPSGLVLDPFAGSGSTAEAARRSGRKAVLIEADEPYCEAVARRLAQDVLPIGGAR